MRTYAGPNTVIRSGQGPQFASAAGTGSQTAISNSGPGAQQTAIGQNSAFPSPSTFGAGTGTGVISDIWLQGQRSLFIYLATMIVIFYYFWQSSIKATLC